MTLTGAGARLAEYARRLLDLNDEALSAASGSSIDGTVTLGVPHDVTETWLPAVIAGFRRSHPSATLKVVEGRSFILLNRLADKQIDLAIVFSATRPESALWSTDLPMVWIGRDDFRLRKNEPTRLAAFDPPCFFRAAAVASLERADMDWSIGYASNTLSDLWGAVKLGLGVAVRTPAAVPAGLHDSGQQMRPSGPASLPRIAVRIGYGSKTADHRPPSSDSGGMPRFAGGGVAIISRDTSTPPAPRQLPVAKAGLQADSRRSALPNRASRRRRIRPAIGEA